MSPTTLAFVLSLLWPQPRQAQAAPELLLRLPVQIVAPAELAAPAALLRRELTTRFGDQAVGTGGTTLRLAVDAAALPHPEEYTLEPGNGELLMRAHEPQGAFWAVHTLATILGQARSTAEGWRVPVPQLRDWPATPARAFMIQGAWTRTAEDYRRNLDLLARQHVTYVALEFGPQVVLDFDPSIAQGAKFSKAQAKELIDYMRSLGLKPIGYLNLLGHLDRAYQKEPYTTHGGIDIRSDEAYDKFVYPILKEMLDVYGPIEFFHAGMDEAWDLFTWLSKEQCDVVGLLARHIERVNSYLKARGVKLVIWHDMLISRDLEKQLGAKVGPANGGPPQNTAAALTRIPKDVILDYWYYDPLPAYPALDYLKGQGFAVWASPWQTPFSFVRYAQQRDVPTLGTLWTGPPQCFASPQYSPVTALYAQAAWNPDVAPAEVMPEPKLTAAAQAATNEVLWARRSSRFPGAKALLLGAEGHPVDPWAAGVEQHAGVPLLTNTPVRLAPLPELSQPLANPTAAAAVLLPGGVRLALDGVNQPRGENQLILYAAPRKSTGTNQYGLEVLVSPTGIVETVLGYAHGDNPIPAGGFVLSAHDGPKKDKYRRLEALHPGDRIGVLDARGDWLGGYAPARLVAELPGGRTLRVDAEDAGRLPDTLVLYHAGYNDGHTGTNEFGVEVVVRDGKVATVRANAGNTTIPADGYVLSAHRGATGAAATAVAALKPGDAVRLLLDKGGKRQDLAQALGERRQVYPVHSRVTTLFLAAATEQTSAPGTGLGEWVVRYADNSRERIPARYGREVLPLTGATLPQRLDDPVWMLQQPGLHCVVREWPNPHPEREVTEVSFEPAPAVLEIGLRLIAATAATP